MGRLAAAATEVPAGRFAVVADPQGAFFSLVRRRAGPLSDLTGSAQTSPAETGAVGRERARCSFSPNLDARRWTSMGTERSYVADSFDRHTRRWISSPKGSTPSEW